MSKYRDLDLNELKSELRNAYVKKALETQIREKEVEREMEKIREDYAANLEKLKTLELKNRAEMMEMELERQREIYKRQLEDQMEEKERARRAQEEEARIERRLLEESDRIVDEQDLAEKLRTKRELRERLLREQRIFQEIREIRKRAQARAEEEETKRNEEYLEGAEQRSRELKTLQQEHKKRREDLINRVAKMLMNFESKKMEREAKIAELLAEEMAWEFVIQEREDELRRKRTREKFVEDLKEQMIFKEECARRCVERDKSFADMVMRRIMEDEKIEKLTNEAKIRSRMVYREDLIRLMEERKRIRQLEQERIKIEFEREMEMEEMRRKDISEARRKLLIEHAPNVAPYVKDSLLTEQEKIIVTKVMDN